MLLPILSIIYFALSLGAIYAVIPIIIIIILILAARGAVSGADLFTMFGVNTLLGAQRVTNPRGSGKGLTKPYRPQSGKTDAASRDMGGQLIGHKTEKKAIGGRWKKGKDIEYAADGTPLFGYDELGRRYDVDKDGILLDKRHDKIPALGEGFQRKVQRRGIAPYGPKAAWGILTQDSLLQPNETVRDAIERSQGRQSDSILSTISGQRAHDAAEADVMLRKLNSEQLNLMLLRLNPASAASLNMMF